MMNEVQKLLLSLMENMLSNSDVINDEIIENKMNELLLLPTFGCLNDKQVNEVIEEYKYTHNNLTFLTACGSKAHIEMNNSCLCRHLILYFN